MSYDVGGKKKYILRFGHIAQPYYRSKLLHVNNYLLTFISPILYLSIFIFTITSLHTLH